jgi:hypothetical protein
MKEPKSKVAAPRQKKAATNSKEKTSNNEAYLKLLSNLKAKLAIAEPEAFAIWQGDIVKSRVWEVGASSVNNG